MTTTAGNPDCLFCKIIAGDIGSRKVDEDDTSFSFLDIAPFHPGHSLVIPKRHVADLVEDPSALAEITPAIDRLSRKLISTLGADGLNMFSSVGAVAGQEVFHLHVHLVPRYADKPGLVNLFGPKPAADAADLDAVWRKITAS